MQMTVDVKRRLVVSAMPTIKCTRYYNSFAVADVRSVFEEVGRNCKHTRRRFAHPGGRRPSRRPPAGGVNNTRRVAPFVHVVTARLQASHHFGNCHFGSSHRQHTFGSQFVHSPSPRAIAAHSSAFGTCGSLDSDARIEENGKNLCLYFAVPSTSTSHTH